MVTLLLSEAPSPETTLAIHSHAARRIPRSKPLYQIVNDRGNISIIGQNAQVWIKSWLIL